MSIWSPHLHYAATALHIFAGVFWLGWIFFLFLILRPVAAKITSGDPARIVVPVRKRIRKIVPWLILIILVTGLYNMGYRGLLDWSVLTGTDVGHRMLWKLGAAGILFGVYFTAPLVGGKKPVAKDSDCHRSPGPAPKKIMAVMHIIAFVAGVTAAYLGITIGG